MYIQYSGSHIFDRIAQVMVHTVFGQTHACTPVSTTFYSPPLSGGSVVNKRPCGEDGVRKGFVKVLPQEHKKKVGNP